MLLLLVLPLLLLLVLPLLLLLPLVLPLLLLPLVLPLLLSGLNDARPLSQGTQNPDKSSAVSRGTL